MLYQSDTRQALLVTSHDVLSRDQVVCVSFMFVSRMDTRQQQLTFLSDVSYRFLFKLNWFKELIDVLVLDF